MKLHASCRASVALLLAFALVAADASAQSLEQEIAAGVDNEVGENSDALPGAVRVVSAGALRKGLALGLSLGYGYTEDVFQLDDKHHRMRGAVAATFRPTPWLAAGLRLDGRYDRHSGGMIESDDGYVGEARVNVLATRPLSDTLSIGGQLVAWVPGGFSGLSFDGKAVATLLAGPAAISTNVGFRLDRSAESVDDADNLSQSDRLALGVSDSNAVLLGLGLAVPAGPLELVAEGSVDLLVGADAPDAIESPIRAGAGVRLPITETHQVTALLEGSFGRVPFVDAMQPLVPVEPLVGIHIVISQRPAAAPRRLTDQTVDPVVGGNGTGGGTKDPKDTDPRATISGLSGTVLDEAGAPIVGAVVRVGGREVLTGDGGVFVAEKLAPGKVTFSVSADGYGEQTETVEIGSDKVRAVNIILKKLVLGSLRGVVRTYAGAPVVAEISVEPGNHRVTSKDDGSFEIKLPTGSYTVTASKDGFRPAKSKAKIAIPGPTVILNLELPKAPKAP